MRQRPPEDLVSLLKDLRLATPEQTAAVEGRARRLASGLPLFRSVWVDALVKARVLTPFQANEINLGRGSSLRLGPYVLDNRVGGLGFGEAYQVRHIDTGELKRLVVFEGGDRPSGSIAEELECLVGSSRTLPRDVLAPLDDWGSDGDRYWTTCCVQHGRTAAEAMVFHGRFAPALVLEIARVMIGGLVALEGAGLVHGDIRAATLVFGSSRGVRGIAPRLPFPGLRSVARPREGYTHLNLPPETFDGLAPERIRDGSRPNTAGDIYACGCLWWHLLTGRDPLPGGDALTKLQTARLAAIGDPRPLAPDSPRELLEAIRACTQPIARDRPKGMVEVASILGASVPRGRFQLGRAIVPLGSSAPRRRLLVGQSPRRSRRARTWTGAAAVCLLAIVALFAVFRPDRGSPCSEANIAIGTRQAASADAGLLASHSDSPPNQGPIAAATIESSSSAADWSVAPSDLSRIGETEVVRASAIVTGSGDRFRTNETKAGSPKVEPVSERAPRPVGRSAESKHPDAPAGGFVIEPDTFREPVARLPLRSGERVHAPRGERATLGVASEGLVVEASDVVFENIDFVLDDSNVEPTRRAILVVRTSGITFRGCTFRAVAPGVDAVRWEYPADDVSAATSLPSGAIVVERCLFAGVETAVDCGYRGAVKLEFVNVLHVGNGPLTSFRHARGPDEPTVLSLERTTLRESGPVARVNVAGDLAAGAIRIETNNCVFSPRAGEPLIAIGGEASPDSLLERIAWIGHGSLVTPGTPIAGHRNGRATRVILAEESIAIDGLVRSDVEFAGRSVERPGDSAAVGWLAPLRTDQAPGIDPSAFDR